LPRETPHQEERDLAPAVATCCPLLVDQVRVFLAGQVTGRQVFLKGQVGQHVGLVGLLQHQACLLAQDFEEAVAPTHHLLAGYRTRVDRVELRAEKSVEGVAEQRPGEYTASVNLLLVSREGELMQHGAQILRAQPGQIQALADALLAPVRVARAHAFPAIQQQLDQLLVDVHPLLGHLVLVVVEQHQHGQQQRRGRQLAQHLALLQDLEQAFRPLAGFGGGVQSLGGVTRLSVPGGDEVAHLAEGKGLEPAHGPVIAQLPGRVLFIRPGAAGNDQPRAVELAVELTDGIGDPLTARATPPGGCFGRARGLVESIEADQRPVLTPGQQHRLAQPGAQPGGAEHRAQQRIDQHLKVALGVV